jgi:hypothetical protein
VLTIARRRARFCAIPISLAVVFFAGNCQACITSVGTSLALSMETRLSKSTAVFLAEVVGLDSDAEQVTDVTVEVSGHWKGAPLDTVVVHALDLGLCSEKLIEGVEYVFFTHAGTTEEFQAANSWATPANYPELVPALDAVAEFVTH